MQENSMDQPTSLSQLLRESYLAEARAHHRHGESSSIDSPSRLVYGTLKEKADDTEPQLPDLSAFLSQEELDKSVDLACKAFSSDPREREERSDTHPPTSHCNLPSSKPTPETEVISERQTVQTPIQDNVIRNVRSAREPAADFRRPQRNAPYGLETQSKKEFLNKAADFIEELSSLFKAGSSKRIRPRAGKTHRSRFQNKTQLDGTLYSINAEDRERPILLNQQMEEPQEKSGVTEEPQEPALIQTESSEEPVCEPPHFIQKLKSREVPEGSKVQLDCIVRGLPAPEVRWFCEGKELENSPDIQIIANGERHTLIIAEAFEEDTGRYSCFASNFYGTDSTSAEIYIEGASSSDSDEEKHFQAELHERSPQPKPAVVLAEPNTSAEDTTPTITTTFAEPPAPSDTEAVPLTELIANPSSKQEDTELLSSKVVSAEIPVLEPNISVVEPTIPVLEPSTPISEVEPTPPISPLTIAPPSPPSSQSISDVLLTSQQSISERWFCEGKELENSPDIQIIANGERHTLIIAEAFEEDTGRYSCFASNFYGTDSTSAEIYIEGASSSDSDEEKHFQAELHERSPQPKPAVVLAEPNTSAEDTTPTITTTFAEPPAPSDTEAVPLTELIANPSSKQEDTELLSSKVVSAEIPVLEPNISVVEPTIPVLEPSTPISEVEPTPPISPLTIAPPSPPSSQSISDVLLTSQQSISETLNGSSSYLQSFDVRPMMAAPVFTKNLQDVLAVESQLVVLECRVKGIPSPKVDWYREGTLIEDSPDFRILQKKPRSMAESEEICTLVIAEVFPEDSGTFTCIASNKYGTVSSTAVLRVKGHNKNSTNPKTTSTLTVESSLQKIPATELMSTSLKHKPDVPLVNNKLHSSMICLDPLKSGFKHSDIQDSGTPRSDSLNPRTLRHDLTTSLPSLNPLSIGKYSSDTLRTSLPQLDPLSFSSSSLNSDSNHKPLSSSTTHFDSGGSGFKPSTEVTQSPPNGSASSITMSSDASVEPLPNGSKPTPSPSVTSFPPVNCSNHQERPTVKPLPDTPTSCLKTRPEGILGNHNESRSSSRVGLRVTFKLLEDEDEEEKGMSSKEPPPVLAKPKLDPVQLQILHNQVLLEQWQEDASPSQDSPHLDRTSCEPPPVKPTHPPANSVPSQLQPPPFVMNSAPIPLQTPASVPLLPTVPASILKAVPVSQFSMPLTNSMPLPQLTPSATTLHNHPPIPQQNLVPTLTNAMGLPKRAPPGPQGALKKNQRGSRLMSDDDIRESKETLLQDIEKKLQFKDEQLRFGQQEYKVSSFEQRLLSEIEFRLERTPVEESDDEVQHDEIPSGKCIAPIFDKKLKHFRAVEGIPVTFTCKVVGIPIPKVYWFKDGKQILKKNVHYKKIREGDGTCSLHIEAVTSDDDGNYTVMAANPQGRISCSGHLIVQTGPVRNRPMVHSQRVRARVQEVEGEPAQERFFRPHFLQAPGDMSAHEGRLCRLDCKVSGLPHPEIMWLLNGRPIYPDLTHRMLVRENGIHSLVIDPLTQADDGTYTCIASNKAGQSSFGLELRVVEKELKQAPHFVEKLQNTGIAEGSPVRLECRVVGMPQPLIFWKKDNDTIPHSKDRVSMHQDTTGYVCLLIQPTRKEDAGWYTVSAKNEAGIISCTARLDLYAQWYQPVHAPMKKTQLSGSRYAALTGQGLDIKSAFSMSDNGPVTFSASQPERRVESEEL
ncbi:LOW QUALITY PROTEIN: myopalladin-like [Sinocyclocheilus grahami]|uniref:LOW QUALITY PROTEIN: myopalladin-like n=1 Tax=Sinocyclocheilus grahami TaxID=75366 RepID=UPI0007ACE97A|nr:PREDICTED: LOW QUALITY PROTEIN: myopalladin-like [Sinocyclocheilus grahami]